MKKALNHSLIYLFTMCLIAIMANSIKANAFFAHTHPSAEASNNNLSHHADESHSPCSEDDIYSSDSNHKNMELSICKILNKLQNETIIYHFSNAIWQPPKAC